ncbi:ABC transporter permease [Reinekea forsetii]|jgi:simple sugar transport system permease protein|uniref:ABC transporter permease n=1 Tax=Reinekea forsetii TaxID=1336806 RepID=UPI002352F7EF|nr:ABC transporter permease [Reinekea forsetii]
MTTDIGLWGVLIAVLGGAVRVGTPFLFVSLGECLTERSGRINLGLEGNLVMGAMVAYAVSYYSESPFLGVIAAAGSGVVLGFLHAFLCQNKRVSHIAVGIALMIFATGLAFFFGKAFIQPTAPRLPAVSLGLWSDSPIIQAAMEINVLFFIGIAIVPVLYFVLKNTRWGLMVRVAGESDSAARALGFDSRKIRWASTMIGGAMASIGGAYLSLYYPGSWNEGLSSGQGLMAVALVIFARWNPIYCFFASLLFGAAAALGPSLQAVGITWGYYLFNAAPYFLTLIILVLSSSADKTLEGMPGEFTR